MHNLKEIIKIGSIAEIRKCHKTGGKSLHATVELSPGQMISRFGAKEILDRPNYLTVQIDDRQHIMLTPEFLQYINHSCSPNVFFDTNKMTVISLQRIKPGEELTFFYPSTEWSIDRGFNCVCGSKDCRGTIQGAAHLSPNVLTQYKLSSYIQQKLAI
ncbi:SET domain-containing protein [Coleofasciculus sp. G2-EDA-02]|uniref:SET domain-containing protein n=1 Tax=Coleofasciculus sp. G2-EDA-02 TaxID=3069529 RepID=UPI00330290FB